MRRHTRRAATVLATIGAVALFAASAATFAGADEQVFDPTGTQQSYTVADDVCAVTVEAFGAQGGSIIGAGGTGGLGAYLQATIRVTPGEQLGVNPGGQGTAGGVQQGPNAGGENGGGLGAAGGDSSGGGGGGASDVRQSSSDPACNPCPAPVIGPGSTAEQRVVVAGGGGGAGGPEEDGGEGGADPGQGGDGSGTLGGDAGTDTAGGAGGSGQVQPGEAGDSDGLGTGGDGGSDAGTNTGNGGGGGGGGYHGGGGGGGDNDGDTSGGGGGAGSSYTTPSATDVVTEAGVVEGDGQVVITSIDNSAPACAIVATSRTTG